MHSYSRVVMTLLLRAAACNKRFTVLVTEARPNSRGYDAAKTLQQNDIPATVILDSAIGYYMGKVDMVLSGGEGVVENGGIVNQIGTYLAAVMAKAQGVPFYAVVESYKFVRCFPLDQYDLPSTTSGNCLFGDKNIAPDEPIENQKLLIDDHPYLDYTPPSYISLLFTDCGILTPSAVSDELIKLYY
jgi:translation initiation factor eIF-2B subunit alpha